MPLTFISLAGNVIQNLTSIHSQVTTFQKHSLKTSTVVFKSTEHPPLIHQLTSGKQSPFSEAISHLAS